MRVYFFTLILFSSLALLAQEHRPLLAAETPVFDRAREFPHYFIDPAFRNLTYVDVEKMTPAQRGTYEEHLTQKRNLLERALAGQFRNMLWPIVRPGSEPRSEKLVAYLKSELGKIDPRVQIVLVGGVARDGLTRIYEQIYEGMLKKNPELPATTLEKLATSHAGVPNSELRGLTSDFDVALIPSRNELFDELKAKTLEILSAASKKFGAISDDVQLKRFFDSHPDVLRYSDFVVEGASQGGTSIDMLGFNLTTERLMEPPLRPGIIRNFMRGKVQYFGALAGATPNLGKQVARYLRTALSLPSLVLENSQTYFANLRDVTADKTAYSSQAVELQLSKALQNIRFQGVHNLFFRAAKGSVDHAALALLEMAHTASNGRLVPPIIQDHPLHLRRPDHNPVPSELLMSVTDFQKTRTDNGVLRHGTPHFTNLISMTRQGLRMSVGGGVHSAQGPGHYMTGMKTAGYTNGMRSTMGLVTEREFIPDPATRILIWNKETREHPFIKNITASVGGVDAWDEWEKIFEVFRNEYHIDIVVADDVLVQNAAVLKKNLTFKSIVNALHKNLTTSGFSEGDRLAAWTAYKKLEKLAISRGEDVPQIGDFKTELTRVLNLPRSEKAELELLRDVFTRVELTAYWPQILADPSIQEKCIRMIEKLGSVEAVALRAKALSAEDLIPGMVHKQGLQAMMASENMARNVAESIDFTSPRIQVALAKAFRSADNLNPGVLRDLLFHLKDENTVSAEFQEVIIQRLVTMKFQLNDNANSYLDFLSRLKVQDPRVTAFALDYMQLAASHHRDSGALNAAFTFLAQQKGLTPEQNALAQGVDVTGKRDIFYIQEMQKIIRLQQPIRCHSLF